MPVEGRDRSSRQTQYVGEGSWRLGNVSTPLSVQETAEGVARESVKFLSESRMREICMSGSMSVAPCKRVELCRLRWRPRQSLASSRVPSLARRPVTATAKRRQGGCRPESSERENSPEIERDRSSRPCLSKGKAESQAAHASGLRCSRGSYRQHATKGIDVNKGDPSGSNESL